METYAVFKELTNTAYEAGCAIGVPYKILHKSQTGCLYISAPKANVFFIRPTQVKTRFFTFVPASWIGRFVSEESYGTIAL